MIGPLNRSSGTETLHPGTHFLLPFLCEDRKTGESGELRLADDHLALVDVIRYENATRL